MLEMSPTMILALFGSSIGAGIFGSLLGIGGGLFIVPVMVLGFHLPMKTVVAASIVSVIATSNAGGSSYVDKHIANLKLAMFLEIFTSIGSIGGALLALHLSDWLISLIFSALILYMGYGSFTTRDLDDKRVADGTFANLIPDSFSQSLQMDGQYYDVAIKKDVRYVVTGAWIGGIISFFAGVASGLLGIGGGVLKVSAMNRYMNVPMKVAVGTSKLMIGITAAVSSVVFLLHGAIHFLLVFPIALGTTLGATMGSSIMNRLRSKNLKWLFVVIVIYMSYSMVARTLDTHWHIHIPYLG